MKKLNLGNINAGLNSLKAATDNAAQNGRFELIDTALIDFAAKNSYAADHTVGRDRKRKPLHAVLR